MNDPVKMGAISPGHLLTAAHDDGVWLFENADLHDFTDLGKVKRDETMLVIGTVEINNQLESCYYMLVLCSGGRIGWISGAGTVVHV